MRIRIRIQLFTSMKILILLLKVMRICDHWPTDPPDLHFESPRLHFERPGPPGLYFQPRNLMNSDLNTDPDPASKNNADPRRSGYETLNLTCPGFINLATSKDTPKKKKFKLPFSLTVFWRGFSSSSSLSSSSPEPSFTAPEGMS